MAAPIKTILKSLNPYKFLFARFDQNEWFDLVFHFISIFIKVTLPFKAQVREFNNRNRLKHFQPPFFFLSFFLSFFLQYPSDHSQEIYTCGLRFTVTIFMKRNTLRKDDYYRSDLPIMRLRTFKCEKSESIFLEIKLKY